MAYQFADGFDNYGNNTALTSGYPWDLAQGVTSSTADFRFSPPGSLPGGCVTCLNSQNLIRKTLSGNTNTLIIGFGIKFTGLPASGNDEFLDLWNTGACQMSLTVNSNGALQFYRSNGSVLGGGFNGQANGAIGSITPNGTIVSGVWYGIIVKITVATGTNGSVSLYLNGNPTPLINSSGINTSGDGTNNVNQISIGAMQNSAPLRKFDDFFCYDNSGVSLNAVPGGDVRILTKLPSGAGNYTNWTPNGLGSNFQNVSVTPPSTLDYNSNNTSTTKDSYTMQSSGIIFSPYFVVGRASLERDDAGPHTPSLFVRSNGTDSTGVVTPALGSSYAFYDALFSTDPSTSAAWTGNGADTAQLGIIEG